MEREYKGSCHCGSIHFSFIGEEINKGLRCNCSICARKGAMMLPYVIHPDEIKIQDTDSQLAVYQFGEKTARHYFCKTCGIYPFHQTVRVPDHYRVNLGCLDDFDTFNLDCEVFDGKHLL